MGQKVHPFGFRVGITEAHKSRWYAPKALYGELLVEDQKIREFCDKRLNRRPPFAAVSDIHIERTREELKVIVRTARPGLVIGPKGSEIDALTQELQKLTGRNVVINCIEIGNPDLEAQLVAESLAEQLKKRASFRRIMKMKADACMTAGAKGVKIQLSGRLGGHEMSRREDIRLGAVPLATLQANIDYGFAEALTTYGILGVKVWIYKGLYEEIKEGEIQSKAAGARPRARGRR
ncbi:30S ribosomal protein S3 [Poriferisphaera corsica]|uniref:Small ribosomal subunit protein uS3 n=1 Tax=Poriferisphaera corsica TaxID=2528020 RepID=A0A517YT19_9BACT|nr:30S ribosomal protein S3 [Poriferisphaera corsica]QDU33370.1 30S ribosomal protein S3 [Poriferisphaera corsica]